MIKQVADNEPAVKKGLICAVICAVTAALLKSSNEDMFQNRAPTKIIPVFAYLLIKLTDPFAQKETSSLNACLDF
ncbi:hypothetical protein K8O68_15325 [Salipaludibacillus sp. CUR1]|uniref:hypothetical protein n=1 Tax=Salipaludibacillus sp. CUR1 TaxID=2820003 RepID=UPI001E3EF4D5|nr:hypothetical protein [Salipaludibacillus sp. CUR1]MCE7793794.1 hypothetical protein [Salipaludibacillus sp. CUR1]